MFAARGLAFFFFFGSAAYLYGATGLAMGALTAPKAGFLPTVVGVLALALSGFDLVRTLRQSPRQAPETSYGRSLAFVLVLAAYIVALPLLGFVAATVVATFLLLKISGAGGYLVPGVIAVALALAARFGFSTLLNLQLP